MAYFFETGLTQPKLSSLDRLTIKLADVQIAVKTLLIQQLLVAALFHDLALVNHKDWLIWDSCCAMILIIEAAKKSKIPQPIY